MDYRHALFLVVCKRFNGKILALVCSCVCLAAVYVDALGLPGFFLTGLDQDMTLYSVKLKGKRSYSKQALRYPAAAG